MPNTAPSSAIPLADHAIDRAAHLRRDEAWLDQAIMADNVQIMIMHEGLPLVTGGQLNGPSAVVWLGPQAVSLSPKVHRIFLGQTERDEPVFALELPASFSLDNSPIAGLGVFPDLRMALSGMNPFDAGLVATARAIFEWRRRHIYCGACGTKMKSAEAGWKHVCSDCGTDSFPRIDPVAIMLVVKDDKCLLGRQAAWPAGMWSCLAGFVEPGESIEQAAARETLEEAGILTTGRAEYLFCQPWPFPSSLMIGLIVEAATDEITVDPAELETARWFSRDELAAIMAGEHPEVVRPRPIAVAHHVMQAWLDRTAK